MTQACDLQDAINRIERRSATGCGVGAAPSTVDFHFSKVKKAVTADCLKGPRRYFPTTSSENAKLACREGAQAFYGGAVALDDDGMVAETDIPVPNNMIGKFKRANTCQIAGIHKHNIVTHFHLKKCYWTEIIAPLTVIAR